MLAYSVRALYTGSVSQRLVTNEEFKMKYQVIGTVSKNVTFRYPNLFDSLNDAVAHLEKLIVIQKSLGIRKSTTDGLKIQVIA
jgi:hypothetical protein